MSLLAARFCYSEEASERSGGSSPVLSAPDALVHRRSAWMEDMVAGGMSLRSLPCLSPESEPIISARIARVEDVGDVDQIRCCTSPMYRPKSAHPKPIFLLTFQQ